MCNKIKQLDEEEQSTFRQTRGIENQEKIKVLIFVGLKLQKNLLALKNENFAEFSFKFHPMNEHRVFLKPRDLPFDWDQSFEVVNAAVGVSRVGLTLDAVGAAVVVALHIDVDVFAFPRSLGRV